MPLVDIITRPKDPRNPTEEEQSWIYEDPNYPGLRFLRNESTERHERALLAARSVMQAGGGITEAGRAYKLPALVTGHDVGIMGLKAWEDMLAAADWTPCHNADASINLDHPDVKAVL